MSRTFLPRCPAQSCTGEKRSDLQTLIFMAQNLCTKVKKKKKENQVWKGSWSENTKCLGRGWREILLQLLSKLWYSDTEAEALKLSKDVKYYRETSDAKPVVSLWTHIYNRHWSIKTTDALISAWELQYNLVWSYSQTLSIFLSLHSHLWLLT